MTKYYVSGLGNDSNDGLTISTPWKTVNKVNSIVFKAGDSIYFRSGDTFYGRLVLAFSGISGHVLTLSSYGLGKKPKICGYKIANNSSSWVNDSTNVWKIDLTDTSKFTGNIYSTNTNVGFIKVDGIIKGIKRFVKTDLASQWEFYSDNQFLYVYSTSNPTTLASDINVAVSDTILPFRNSLFVTGLDIAGGGGHGIEGSVSSSNVINCEIHELGGSTLTGTTRYGNGVQVWSGSKDVLIENNKIYDCYDVAYTMQGGLNALTGGLKGWENVVYRNNTDWNCTQSFEVWSDYSGGSVVVGTGFYNCLYENNHSLNAGRGWGYDARPDKNSAVSILIYQMLAPDIDITARNNTIYNPRNGAYYASQTVNNDIPFKTINNNIFLLEGTKIHFHKTYIVEQFENFKQDTGKDKGSSFFILPTSTTGVPAKISSLLGATGKNTSQLKILQEVVNNLNGKIEEIKSNLVETSSIINTTKGTEIQHLSGFMKASGGYVTSQSSTVTDGYAPLFRCNLKDVFARIDLVMSYMLGSDSVLNRGSVGFINLQIVPNSTLTVGTQVDLDVVEVLDFNSTTALTSQDFVLVVEKEDGTEVQATLYFNIAKDAFARLAYQPLTLYTSAIKPDSYTFFDKATLLSVLPSGTQYRPSTENPYVKRPKTGTTAPTTTPYYIGQEFIDTTNKKVYKAAGTSSTADWALLN